MIRALRRVEGRVREGRERARTITRRQAALGAVAALGAAGAAKLIYDQMYTDEPEPKKAEPGKPSEPTKKHEPTVAHKTESDTAMTSALTELTLTTVPADTVKANVTATLGLTGDAATVVTYLLCAYALAGTTSTLTWIAAGISAYKETSTITKLAATVVMFACVVGDMGFPGFLAMLETCRKQAAGTDACTGACMAPFEFVGRAYRAKSALLRRTPAHTDFTPADDGAFLASMGEIAGKCAGYMWRDDTDDARAYLITAILLAMANKKTIVRACQFAIRWNSGSVPATGARIAPSGAPGFTSKGWITKATLQRDLNELRDTMARMVPRTQEWVQSQIWIQFLFIVRIFFFVAISLNTFIGPCMRMPCGLADALATGNQVVQNKIQQLQLSHKQVGFSALLLLCAVPIFLWLFPGVHIVTHGSLANAAANATTHNVTGAITAQVFDPFVQTAMFDAFIAGLAINTDAAAIGVDPIPPAPTNPMQNDTATPEPSDTLDDQISAYVGELNQKGALIPAGWTRNEALRLPMPYYTNLAGLPEYSAKGKARMEKDYASKMREKADTKTQETIAALIKWALTKRKDASDASILLQHKALVLVEWALGGTPTIISDDMVLNLHHLSSSIAATAREPSAANKAKLGAALARFTGHQCEPKTSLYSPSGTCDAINVARALITLDETTILASRIYCAFHTYLEAKENAVTRIIHRRPAGYYDSARHISHTKELLDQYKRAAGIEGAYAAVKAAAEKLYYAQSIVAGDATAAIITMEGRLLWELDINENAYGHVRL